MFSARKGSFRFGFMAYNLHVLIDVEEWAIHKFLEKLKMRQYFFQYFQKFSMTKIVRETRLNHRISKWSQSTPELAKKKMDGFRDAHH